MKVGILWHVVYPWDIRMEKIIKVLLADGHEVHLVCKGKTGLAPVERIGQLTIHRIASSRDNRLGRLLGAPLPVNPMWYRRALQAFREAGIDRIVVRDLPLALLAGWLAKRLRVPAYFDMAENYPAALVAYNNNLYKPFLFGNSWLPRMYERLSLRYMERVFVVAEEQADRLVAAGFPRARISIVMNTPDVDYYQRCVQETTADPSFQGTRSILYVGKVDAHRGVDLLVRALPSIARLEPTARMVIVGDGTHKGRLEALAAELGVTERVQFAGWVPFQKVPGFVAASALCVIPHLKSEHTETTVPNKIFDYMAFAKPVIASDCGPLARIVRDARCGDVFVSGDADDLARKVLSLLASAELGVTGENGRHAVAERYHWDVDAAMFLDTLKASPGARSATQLAQV